MKLHLLGNTRLTQDGTYSIQQISKRKFAGVLKWGTQQGIIENHITTRSLQKHGIDPVTEGIPRYRRNYELENGDLFLIAENGKFYNGSYINQCPQTNA